MHTFRTSPLHPAAFALGALIILLVAVLPHVNSISVSADRIAQVPLVFAAPLNTTNPEVYLESRTPAGTLSFTRSGAALSLPDGDQLDVRFVASRAAAVRGVEPLPGVINSLRGNDPTAWKTDIPTYAAVVYESLYPGIDLRYDGREGALKGTFLVAPHVDPAPIRWRYPQAQTVAIDPASGDLRITLATGRRIVEHAPVAWQETPGRRVPVTAHFVLYNPERNEVGFALGSYDPAMPLVIDPTLVYGTYLGGSGAETAYDSAIDAQGNMYLVGGTTSPDFPLLNPLKDTNTGAASDVFLTKLDPQGRRIFSTYLGGDDSDRGLGIALDGAGNIYLTGQTGSADFPTRDALQNQLRGSFDAFVVKLNATGSELQYSTFFGGSLSENTPAGAAGIAVDADGTMVITGLTNSTDLPVLNATQADFGGMSDAFVAAFRSDGQAVLFATYLGGERDERPRDLTLDSAGAIYLTGYTTSSAFPTKNAYQDTIGSLATQDAFVGKVNRDGTLAYATYLGGSGTDEGFGITVSADGSAHITGSHGYGEFPSVGVIRAIGGTGNAFVATLNPSGTELQRSVWFGGSGRTVATDLALDPSGSLYIAGHTDASDFPRRNPSQEVLGGGSDAFVLRLDAEGCAVIGGTFFGGSGDETNLSLAVNNQGDAYIAGTTDSADLPLKGAQQTVSGGSSDVFAARVTMDGTPNCRPLQLYLPTLMSPLD